MQFKLPELGEGVYEGEVVRWVVNEGDVVKPGQTLVEVLTDKATMEVPAPFSGTIDKFLVDAGDKIEVGQAILEYQGKGAAATKSAAKEEKEPKKAKEPENGAAKEETEQQEPTRAEESPAPRPPAE